MNGWSVEFSQDARKFLHKLRDERLKERIGFAIDRLAGQPRPPTCKALAGMENTYRIRVGDYRVIYKIQDQRLVVLVIQIGHRREVYR
jgi:mRNA interferase RelE/StbE